MAFVLAQTLFNNKVAGMLCIISTFLSINKNKTLIELELYLGLKLIRYSSLGF